MTTITSNIPNTKVSASAYPSSLSKTQVVDKEDTPSYKTYPFALGTGGLVLGGLGGLIKTNLEPDVYSKTEANGESKRLEVHYSKQGNQPLAYARYDHFNSNCEKGQKHFLPDSAVFNAQDDDYIAKIPYYTTNDKGLNELTHYEETLFRPQGLKRRRQFSVESPLDFWRETPFSFNLLDNMKPKAAESSTRLVELQLKMPRTIEGAAVDCLTIFHEGANSKIAHTIVNGREIEVALNEKGEIHKSKIDALNGLPVLFKESLPDMENVMKDVPAYVKKLQKSLQKEEKAFGKNIFLGALATGAVGYGLGWFLDWKKRHDRKKVEAEKPSRS
ncbi:MAG: hypothetical protein LW809_02050 [Vampirovibrionales bacterium]|jgi:hypothetical protein|nr:hypothetical protein [Vampirovibrionales bacterium]